VRDEQWQFSQELTIVRRAPALTWIGGMFFFDEQDHAPVHLAVLSVTPQVEIRPFSTIGARAWALFGEATYRFSSRLSVTGGVRYSDEHKDMHNSGGRFLHSTWIPAPPPPPNRLYDFVDEADFSAWTPKASIQLHASRDTFLYASATRGFKSGGLNATAQDPGGAFGPEFAWSYEAGLKRTLVDGRLRTRTAVFYNDYRDLQVQRFVGLGLSDVRNAASARITGAEVEVLATPAGRLQLAGNLSWLHARYERFIASVAVGVDRDVSGNRLNVAPCWSGSGSMLYEVGLGRAGTATVRGDVSWQSLVFFTPFNDSFERQGAYGLVHLRAGVEPRDRRWELAVFVRNAANQEYITVTGTTPLAPSCNGRPGEPRHWGNSSRFDTSRDESKAARSEDRAPQYSRPPGPKTGRHSIQSRPAPKTGRPHFDVGPGLFRPGRRDQRSLLAGAP
jgi:iron complex outermembrane receptor protein